MLPEPEYIDLEEAAKILQQSVKRIQFYIDKEFLCAYTKTPCLFPPRPSLAGISGTETYESFASLAMCFNEALADICRLKPLITWRDGAVECDTIIVTDESGNVPSTDGCMTLAETDGRIGPGGEICIRGSAWTFAVENILLERQEVLRFARDEPTEQDKSEIYENEEFIALIKEAYPEAEKIYDAIKKKAGCKNAAGEGVKAAAECFNKQKWSLVKKKYLTKKVLCPSEGRGGQERIDIIGKLLKVIAGNDKRFSSLELNYIKIYQLAKNSEKQ